MTTHRAIGAAVLCATLAGASSIRAEVILDAAAMPGDSIVNDFSMFDGHLIQEDGPVDLGDGVVWTADYEGWIGDMAFGLRDNGVWNWDRVGFAGLNASDSFMVFTFDAPVNAVGGLVNYAPFQDFGPIPTLEALDADGNVIERFAMDVRTPGEVNAGQFIGIVRESADIYALRFIARFGVLDDFTYHVPVPSAAAMLAVTGTIMLGRRRRRMV